MVKDEHSWQRILADIGRARTPQGRTKLGCVSIEGLRLHERALRAGVAVEVALAGKSFVARADDRIRRLLRDLEGSGSTVRVVPDDVILELTEGRDTGAIVGLVRLPPAPRSEASLPLSGPRPHLLLAAVELEDPGNVGAMIRTALAAGASSFIAVGISDPYHPKAVRTSMGAVFRIPVLRHDRAATLPARLKRHGVTTVGAVSKGGRAPEKLNLAAHSIAVLIGSEAFGLSSELCSEVDHLVSIPMSSEVDSYSANAAAAILLYALRHRA